MSGSEVLSMAIFRARPGHEEECLSVTQELSVLLANKGYAQDTLFRQPVDGEGGDYVLLRRWSSDEARLQTHDDPEVHRYWLRMGLIMETIQVYERLDEVAQQPGM